MNVLCVVNGYLEENCYIIHNNKKALIIDPGSDGEKIVSLIDSLGLSVVGVLITHYHFDHIGALDYIKNKYKDIVLVDYKNRNKIPGFDFEIIENFGHTLDSVSYYFKKDKIMFTGDFVFKETIGNYNDEDEEIMYESLKKFILMDKDITIYPGHGEKSSIGYEIKNNPYLRGI